VVYWPVEQLRELFARQCDRDGVDPAAAVEAVAGDELGVEEFWERARDNLRAERVRMVFVSDEIPCELVRVVEFLNGQMSPAEVIAIEIKQYVGADGMMTLVPRIIGQTAQVDARKGRRTSADPSSARGAEARDHLDRAGSWRYALAGRASVTSCSAGLWFSSQGQSSAATRTICVIPLENGSRAVLTGIGSVLTKSSIRRANMRGARRAGALERRLRASVFE
jgi:hypothetical protein